MLLPSAGCLPAISDVDTGFFPYVPIATPLNAGALQSALLGPVLRTPGLVPCNCCGDLPRTWWLKIAHARPPRSGGQSDTGPQSLTGLHVSQARGSFQAIDRVLRGHLLSPKEESKKRAIIPAS